MNCRRIWMSMALVVLSGVPVTAFAKTFTSPLKNFTVPVPKLEMGTKIQKSNEKESGYITFLGGEGDMRKIDYVVVLNAPTDSSALGARLDAILGGIITKANATLIGQAHVTIDGALMSFASATFPGASGAVDMHTGKNMDIVRCMFATVRGKYLYVVTAQLGGFAAVVGTPEARVENTRRWLGEFLATITFQ